MTTNRPDGSRVSAPFAVEADDAVNRLLRRVYQAGGAAVAGLLLIGLIAHLVRGADIVPELTPGGGSGWWFRSALLLLWAVPTASLFVAACGWLFRRRGDPAGWLAMSIGIFLLSLWIVR